MLVREPHAQGKKKKAALFAFSWARKMFHTFYFPCYAMSFTFQSRASLVFAVMLTVSLAPES